MTDTSLSHIRSWVFDLDNTLYHPSANLFGQIEKKMTAWIMENFHLDEAEADRLRLAHWMRYGSTLAGLMATTQIDPDPFIAHTHDIDFSGLSPDPALKAALDALPGRKIVFTNGAYDYAHHVLRARGIVECFDGVFGVEAAQYHPKPEQAAYDAVFTAAGIDPLTAVMFDDDPRNLLPPHHMGLRTVLVRDEGFAADYIDHHTADLTKFLQSIT